MFSNVEWMERPDMARDSDLADLQKGRRKYVYVAMSIGSDRPDNKLRLSLHARKLR
jgi:hypothetical protein